MPGEPPGPFPPSDLTSSGLVCPGPVRPDLVGRELVDRELAGPELVGRELVDRELAGPELVGRAAETAAIRLMLDDARLVTVTGPPGVGKTAVTLAAAGAAAGSFADGSLLLRLDTLRDEILLPHTILAALQLPDQFTRGPLEVLTDQLRDRHLLLILDTCEHLLGACAGLVAALLPLCPKVQVLATSREPLRVPGEAAMAVRPLRLTDAVRLFGQRAAEAGAEPAPQNLAAVASICVQLDKLPLAIELAAAELAKLGEQSLSLTRLAKEQATTAALAELLARLEAGQTSLGGSARGSGQSGRHQTLRAAIGWSHELCTPSERLLWARLSIFTGPFGLRDAQDVCTTRQLSDETVAAALTLLAERSVLLSDRQAGGNPRFLLPATLRAYGRQMLRQLDQEEEFIARHQGWQDGRRHRYGAPEGK